MGIKRVYENFLSELSDLEAAQAPEEVIDAIRFAAQVCQNVAIGEATELGIKGGDWLELKNSYSRHTKKGIE